jgi:hypothetical protein
MNARVVPRKRLTFGDNSVADKEGTGTLGMVAERVQLLEPGARGENG